MIQLTQGLDTSKILTWLESHVAPHLTPDVSNYAKGRMRAWLKIEPPLGASQGYKEGVEVSDVVWKRLQDIITWEFDYCLATFSGEEKAIGIKPHRDSTFAAYEAMGLNVSGTCKFSYWNERESFTSAPPTAKWPVTGPPSHVFELKPGDLVRFNCKNNHSAEPSTNRWNLNFWKKKIQSKSDPEAVLIPRLFDE